MKLRSFFLVGIFLFCLGPVLGQHYKQDQETYRAALELFYIDKDYHSVIKACEEISSREVTFDVERLLGKAYVQIGKIASAEYALNEAYEGSSEDPMSWFLLGNVRMLLGKFDIAIVNYKSAINRLESVQDLDVQLFPFLEAKGRCYRIKGDFILAERDFHRAIELGSRYAQVEMANIYLQKNDRKELSELLESMKLGSGFGFEQDANTELYLELMETYALGLTVEESIDNVSLLIDDHVKNKTVGFSAFEYDLYYLKYRMLRQIGLKDKSYSALKTLSRLNSSNPNIQSDLLILRNDLNIDAAPPEISIINPPVSDFNMALVQQESERYTLFGSVSDECAVSEMGIKINGRAINTIEEDGIFTYNMELHAGDNPVVIDALDGEGNASRKEFVIQFDKNQDYSTFGHVSIRPEDIPKLREESVYHAILIAQGNYYDSDFTDLDHPVQDSRKLKQILTGLYGFNEENITMLENKGRSDLLSELDSVSSTLTSSDNLLVFYAGHGDAKRVGGEITGGYIIPSDSRYNEHHTYISSSDLFLPFKGCNSKHILFVVDACFGGSLYRSANDQLSDQPFINSNRLSSRNLISSGNLEVVPDRSVFIQNLFDCLEKTDEHILAASTIYEYIRMNNTSSNVPQHRAIRDYGDKGGMFHFVRDVISDE